MAFNYSNIQKTLSYSAFSKRMLENINGYICDGIVDELKNNGIKPAEYAKSGEAEICMCPEPINFYSEVTKMERTEDKLKKFEELKSGFKKYTLHRPEGNYWLNQTSNGINIRLGNKDEDSGDQSPAVLGDDCVHGVIVGRTGAGKSVLINNIILNLISEYSPWELDLFLVDMKKVELSRYMTKLPGEDSFITPQVSACAATSEVRYVVSMIEYLCNCMKARQTLFAALGVQKLSDFRDKFGVKLPRVLLLVDEFQQLFLEASGKEKRILEECITAITKLGRATGFHLLFASQEMSGALGAKELANFKLRIALPCDEGISTQILGNSAAAKITEKGITLVNKRGGSSEIDNIMYRTPFVNDKAEPGQTESEFTEYLHTIYNITKVNGYGFSKNQKFYQEDVQDKIAIVEKIKHNPSIMQQIENAKSVNSSIIDAFVLGSGVLYTNKTVDFESVFLEKGKRRNIGILCVKDEDILSVLHTLVANFSFSKQRCNHFVDYESELLRSGYVDLISDLKNGENSILASEINFEDINEEVTRIMKECEYNRLLRDITADRIANDKGGAAFDFIRNRIIMTSRLADYHTLLLNTADGVNKKINKNGTALFDINSPNVLTKIVGDNNSVIVSLFDDVCSKESLNGSTYEELYNDMRSKLTSLANKLESKHNANPKEYVALFQSIIIKYVIKELIPAMRAPNPRSYTMSNDLNVFWILGMDNIDAAADKFLMKILDTCTMNNMLFILAGNNIEADRSNIPFKLCNYMFLSSPNESLYTKFKMSFTKRSDDNKSVDFKIINFNSERSFKLFRAESKAVSAPRLNFDDWR